MATDPITDFSRTKRVVFLIDLDPLLDLQNPEHFLSCLVSSAKSLLFFPPLSSSLFSFKPFFSSLSPILSSSKLPSSSLHLSFDDPPTTLRSLRQFLSSLPNFSRSSTSNCPPPALNIAASLRQLLLDYFWDAVIDDNSVLVTPSPCISAIRSNLVVLFSPIGRGRDWLSQLIGVEMEDDSLTSVDLFSSKFCGFFQNVSGSFISKDIHCSWVDMKYAPECGESEGSEFIVSGIRSLGWGFCSTQSISFSPALVPFGLIYPSIGLTSKTFGSSGADNSVRTYLGLEIAGKDGNPLECKLAELQLVSLKNPFKYMGNDAFLSIESANLDFIAPRGSDAWLEQFMGGVVKIEAVEKHEKFANIKEKSSEMILIQDCSKVSEKDRKDDCCSEFFADRMLQIVASEMGELVRESPPLWQIFLIFMYRQGYWALVSLPKSNGDRCFGVLKPFSISSALIALTNDDSSLDDMVNNIRSTDPQSEPLGRKGYEKFAVTKSKMNPKILRSLQDLTWSQFQKGEQLEGLEVRLDELYLAWECKKAKQLKFLICWMKQVKRSMCSRMSSNAMFMPQTEIPEDGEAETNQVSEQPISASDPLTAASGVQGEVPIDCGLESSEDVLNDIPDKIQKALESKGVDLGTLAQRLVSSSIYCLYQKPEMKDDDNDCLSKVASEVTRLLLREPKDLSEKNKSRELSSQTLDQEALAYVVREYELQILFRLEILRSEISAAIEDSSKQKFIKQICSLLEYIQCHLEGFHGDWSLYNYVGKIIQSRYSEDLEDVVHQIYSKMDLLIFDQEDEMPNSLLNSEEESGQSWRDKSEEEKGEMGKHGGYDRSISVECESRAAPRKSSSSKRDKLGQRLIIAQERRERARSVASYTSWAPDLQRVWAPKQQPNASRANPELLAKQMKRKDQRSATRDRVCETPMTMNKRSCLQRNESPDEKSGMNRSGSVPKSLFQLK